MLTDMQKKGIRVRLQREEHVTKWRNKKTKKEISKKELFIKSRNIIPTDVVIEEMEHEIEREEKIITKV